MIEIDKIYNTVTSMTNEELTAAFPECERIKREQVAPFVEQVLL